MTEVRRSATAAASERIASLDALRAGALFLGVVLHSLMSVGTIGWVVTDDSRVPVADAIINGIHVFRMPLFFALAGYFARGSLARRGPRRFAADRAKRILAPLVALWPVAVLPVIVVAIAFAITHPDVPTTPPSDDPLAIATPAHLWFLWSLTQLYVLLLLASWLLLKVTSAEQRERVSDALARVLTGPAAPLWAAIPLVAALWLQPSGIVGPATLRPELPATLAFGGAFGVGWCWAGAADALDRLRRGWQLHLAGAIVLTGMCLIIGVPAPGQSSLLGLLTTLVAYPLATWLWVYGLVGFAATWLRAPRTGVRYLAEASYWVYLTHLGWVCLLQFAVADLAWPWPVKVLLVLAGTMVATLSTYHLLVRSTPIGRWLNGRTYPYRTPPAGSSVPTELTEASR